MSADSRRWTKWCDLRSFSARRGDDRSTSQRLVRSREVSKRTATVNDCGPRNIDSGFAEETQTLSIGGGEDGGSRADNTHICSGMNYCATTKPFTYCESKLSTITLLAISSRCISGIRFNSLAFPSFTLRGFVPEAFAHAL